MAEGSAEDLLAEPDVLPASGSAEDLLAEPDVELAAPVDQPQYEIAPGAKLEFAERVVLGKVLGQEGLGSKEKSRHIEDLLKKDSRGEQFLESVSRYRPEPEGGTWWHRPLEQLADVVDVGFFAAGKSVVRPIHAEASAEADFSALMGKTNQGRIDFLGKVHEKDDARGAYEEIVFGLNQAEDARNRIKRIAAENGYAYGERPLGPTSSGLIPGAHEVDVWAKGSRRSRSGVSGLSEEHASEIRSLQLQMREGFTSAGSGGNKLSRAYFDPNLPGFSNNRSPYGGDAPRPWEGPSDVTENILRGLIGMDDPETLDKSRKFLQKASGLTIDLLMPDWAIYNAERGDWLTTSRLGDKKLEILKEKLGADVHPLALINPLDSLIGLEARKRLKADRDRRIEAGDYRNGLFLFEAATMIGPDLAMPKTPRVLVTPAGRLTEKGDRAVRGIQEKHLGDLAEHYAEISAARLDDGLDIIPRQQVEEGLNKLRADIDGEIARIGDEALSEGKAISGFDFSDSIHLTGDGVEFIGGKAKPVYSSIQDGAKPLTRKEILNSDDIFAGRKSGFANVVDGTKNIVAEIKVAMTSGERLVQVTPELRKSLKFDTFGEWVVETASGGYRELSPRDLIGQNQVAAMDKLGTRLGTDASSIMKKFDEAAFHINKNTANAEDRALYGSALEILGNPSPDTAEGLLLLDSLREAILDGLDLVPHSADAPARAAASRIRAAQKASSKAKDLAEKAASSQSDELIREAGVAADIANGLAADAHVHALMANANKSLAVESSVARTELRTANKNVLAAESELAKVRQQRESVTGRARAALNEMDDQKAFAEIAEMDRNAAELASKELDVRIAREKADVAREIFEGLEESVRALEKMGGPAQKLNLNDLTRLAGKYKREYNLAVKEIEGLSSTRNRSLEVAQKKIWKQAEKVPRLMEESAEKAAAGSRTRWADPAALEAPSADRLLTDMVVGAREAQREAGRLTAKVGAEELPEGASVFERRSLSARKGVATKRRKSSAESAREAGALLESETNARVATAMLKWVNLRDQARNIGREILSAAKRRDFAEMRRLTLLHEKSIISLERKSAAVAKSLAKEARKTANEAKAAAKKAVSVEVRARSARADLVRARKAEGVAMAKSAKAMTIANRAAEVVESIGGREAAPLRDFLLETMQRNYLAGQEVRQILTSVLGYATKSEAAAIRAAEARINLLEHSMREFASDATLYEVLGDVTVAEAQQATRALERIAEGRAPDLSKLTDKARDALDIGRNLLEDMYEVFKAAGKISKDHSKEKFLEDMLLEGYLPHIMTVKGARKIRKILGEKGALSTVIASSLRRTKKGSVEELNQLIREDTARMLYEEARSTYKGMSREDAIAAIIKEHGLDKISVYEADAVKIFQLYGRGAAKGLANTRLIRETKTRYPRHAEFAAMAKQPGGVAAADAAAKEAGYVRVSQASHMELYIADPVWAGWKDHAKEIRAFMKAGVKDKSGKTVPVTKEDLLNKLKQIGADTSRISNEELTFVTSEYLYAPAPIAAFLEDLVRPDWMKSFKEADNVMLREMGLSFDEYLRNWKMMVTIFAPAFHGRNAISNVIQNTLVHGTDALNPSTYADSFAIMYGADDALHTIRWVDDAGVEHLNTKTFKEWRQIAERTNVDTEMITVTDVGATFASKKTEALGRAAKDFVQNMNPETRAALMKHAGVPFLAGSAGAVYGFNSAEEEADFKHKMTMAVGYGAAGLFAGMAGKTHYDVFMSDGHKAYQHAKSLGKPNKQAMLDGWNEAYPAYLELLKSSARVGAFSATTAGVTAGTSIAVGLTTAGASTALQIAAGAGMTSAGAKVALESLAFFAGGVGKGIERQARYVNWITGMKKGMSPEASAHLVNQTLFDYNKLSSLERHTMRRIFPFWTWNSKNFRLQGWLMDNRPKTYIAQARVLDMLQKDVMSAEDMATVPPHLRYRIAAAYGNGKIISGFGHPIEPILDLTKPGLGGVFSNVHPTIPLLMKFGAFGLGSEGKDPYFGVDITELRSARDVRFLPEFVQEWVGYGTKVDLKTGKPKHVTGLFADELEDAALGAKRMALLRSFEVWRLVSEWNKVVVDSFMTSTTQGVVGEPATAVERLLSITSGIKPYARRPEEIRDLLWFSYERRLMDILEERGLIKSMKYAPSMPPIRVKEASGRVDMTPKLTDERNLGAR